ncbi:uncharacterized protein Dwil_GK11327 [Drosophila willistoni]|uniref:Uncharacterized protein n=2 Tax=Drosophila willistoni TaxID=7260 RepID=B4NAQ6_DROWI|nr:uncharacterized protein Dwil_GK11327 [Drosophila willistoni]
MYTKVVCLLNCLFLLQQCSVEARSMFGVGNRLPEDQLLLKDVQHSRPAGLNEQPSVTFQYEIAEPITYIEIVSKENILAEVKFSYINQLIVGVVTGYNGNTTTKATITDRANPPPGFNVTIMIFGLNDTKEHMNPSLFINRDQQFEGELLPDYDELNSFVEMDSNQDDYDDDYTNTELSLNTLAEKSDEDEYQPNEKSDKIIEIGRRQKDDRLVYETYQTSADSSKAPTNHSVIFYYIDSESITYVKFVIFDHFNTQQSTSPDYMAPVAEYSHYSNNTLKAIVSDFKTTSLFVQMFVYGYRPNEVPPSYEPFLPPPHWQRAKEPIEKPLLTPMQRIQLALLMGKSTTPPAFPMDEENFDEDDDDDDGVTRRIRPEDMEFIQVSQDVGEAKDESNAALPQLDLGFGAFVGLFLLILHNIDN